MGRGMKALRAVLLASAIGATASAANAAQIVLNNIVGVEPGTDAYRGFLAASTFWGSRITNNITINLDVGFDHLGPNILGSTSSSIDIALTQDIYSRLAANQHSALDATAVSNLQPLQASQFGGIDGISMITPGYTGDDGGVGTGIDNSQRVLDDDGSINNVVMGATTANLKALGLLGPTSDPDGSITFSSDFAFDFDPTDGITDGQIDFIAVAIHEIGHALGFVSAVDDYDVLGLPNGPFAGVDCTGTGILCQDYPVNDTWWGYTGDLFRYDQAGELDWKPGDANYFSVDGGATNLAGFSTGDFNGDGWQGSHWKAPTQAPFCSGLIGIMNPYACDSTTGIITGMDFAFFDAIGYNFNFDYSPTAGALYTTADAFRAVPEPGVWTLMIGGFALAGAALRRRRLVRA